MSDKDKPIDRRRFFREGLRSLFENVGRAAGPMQKIIKELEAQGQKVDYTADDASRARPTEPAKRSIPPGVVGAAASVPTADRRPRSLRILRPPGAKQPDSDFVSTCSACGNCAAVCPVHAIKFDPEQAGGAAFIVAEHQPCTLCDGLHCMYACPTGALTALPIGLINMGTAVWRDDLCVRSQGTECSMCVDRCPIGNRAIELIGGKIVVHEEGCTGCGVCEHECPTTPKSIWVKPAEE